MLIARSPVRISFGGGGTDLPAYFEHFGGAVLSTAINKYFYTIVGTRSDDLVQVISSDLRKLESWKDVRKTQVNGGHLDIPLAVLRELNCQKGIDLFLASEIPPGTGLGSSASVCVNVLQAVSAYMNEPLTKQELAEKAFHIATKVLKKLIGKQDEYASAFGGLNYIVFREDGTTEVRPVQIQPSVVSALQRKLMLFFTGASHDSWAILSEQTKQLDQSKTTLEALHRIREHADMMHQALLEGDLARFGSLLHEGWQQKKKVSKRISNSTIDGLYDLARKNGAAGGKITGAGGGGFMLLYCNEEHQSAVRKAFADKGIQEMRFEFDFNGSRVIVNDPFLDRNSPVPYPASVGA